MRNSAFAKIENTKSENPDLEQNGQNLILKGTDSAFRIVNSLLLCKRAGKLITMEFRFDSVGHIVEDINKLLSGVLAKTSKKSITSKKIAKGPKKTIEKLILLFQHLNELKVERKGQKKSKTEIINELHETVIGTTQNRKKKQAEASKLFDYGSSVRYYNVDSHRTCKTIYKNTSWPGVQNSYSSRGSSSNVKCSQQDIRITYL